MKLTRLSIVCIAIFARFANSSDTTCEESQKHFANLCFSPQPTDLLDIEWTQNSQPEDGWHIEIGNDIARLHYAEVLRGELLTLQDNFDNTCFRFTIEHGEANGEFVVDGTLYGFGNLTSKWDCNLTKDYPGVVACDISSSGFSKYHEYVRSYITYSDNKNVQVGIDCYPNGQVGWTAFSVTKTLTDEEKKAVSDHIKSLGFSDDNTVTLYNENCSNETK